MSYGYNSIRAKRIFDSFLEDLVKLLKIYVNAPSGTYKEKHEVGVLNISFTDLMEKAFDWQQSFVKDSFWTNNTITTSVVIYNTFEQFCIEKDGLYKLSTIAEKQIVRDILNQVHQEIPNFLSRDVVIPLTMLEDELKALSPWERFVPYSPKTGFEVWVGVGSSDSPTRKTWEARLWAYDVCKITKQLGNHYRTPMTFLTKMSYIEQKKDECDGGDTSLPPVLGDLFPLDGFVCLAKRYDVDIDVDVVERIKTMTLEDLGVTPENAMKKETIEFISSSYLSKSLYNYVKSKEYTQLKIAFAAFTQNLEKNIKFLLYSLVVLFEGVSADKLTSPETLDEITRDFYLTSGIGNRLNYLQSCTQIYIAFGSLVRAALKAHTAELNCKRDKRNEEKIKNLYGLEVGDFVLIASIKSKVLLGRIDYFKGSNVGISFINLKGYTSEYKNRSGVFDSRKCVKLPVSSQAEIQNYLIPRSRLKSGSSSKSSPLFAAVAVNNELIVDEIHYTQSLITVRGKHIQPDNFCLLPEKLDYFISKSTNLIGGYSKEYYTNGLTRKEELQRQNEQIARRKDKETVSSLLEAPADEDKEAPALSFLQE